MFKSAKLLHVEMVCRWRIHKTISNSAIVTKDGMDSPVKVRLSSFL